VEVVASISQGLTAAAQCGLFTHKSVPAIFEPPCILHEDLLVARQGVPENCALLGYFAQRSSYLIRCGNLKSRKEYAFVSYLHV